MIKVLLVGKLTDIVRSLNENLSDDFNVQISTLQIDNVMGMVNIVKPELIVLCLVGVDKVDMGIFDWMNGYAADIPVLVVTSKTSWDMVKHSCSSERYQTFFPPINKATLVDACYQTLQKVQEESAMKKILVIDDDATVLRFIKKNLETMYDIIVAKSGEKGIEKAVLEQPDLILLDYEMPEMDGNETFAKMRRIDSIKDIPVIFLTGVSDRNRVCAVLDNKPAGYILKPPVKSKLIKQIEDILKTDDDNKEE